MKYWWGYLIAAIFGAFSWAITQLGEKYSDLVDMVYPYVTREVQTMLSQWTGTVDTLVWQVAVVAMVVIALALLVVVIIMKGSVVRYVGWVLAVASMIFFLQTGMYGLNYCAGPIADDIRMSVDDYTQFDLELATEFYRDKANELSTEVSRDADGNPDFPEFADLAKMAGEGFVNLTYDRSFSIFGGDTSPVKRLGWAEAYTSMGITGFTCFLTGEAAVNPMIPASTMPFTMCHEMAHRMCIAREDDANFAAFLACEANEAPEYRYSGYFMAFRYCYNALASVDSEAAGRIKAECTDEMLHDLEHYDNFFRENRDEAATRVADSVNDTYLKASGDEKGIASYGAVCDQLVNWYITEYATPEDLGEPKFDPYDETQVDLSGIVNYNPPETQPAETAPAETTAPTEGAQG